MARRTAAHRSLDQNSPGGPRRAWFGGPLWTSGFRPFFLLGTAYGLIALGVALPRLVGGTYLVPVVEPAAFWHGHEMIFGFAVAIICGLLLTALPSWAGVPEQTGPRLAFLVFTWLAGRLAVVFAPMLSPVAVAIVDATTLVALSAMLLPGLITAADKRYLAVLPVLLALAAANVAFHGALASGSLEGASRSLDVAVATIAVLFSLAGGLLTPVFTRNALDELGAIVRVREHRLVEVAAHASAVAFALAVALSPPPRVVGGFALAACVAHALRLGGWRGLAVRKRGLAFAMHVAYAWLVAAFALAAAPALVPGIASRAWVHAVTIGAVGTMMLSLMPRVAMRHTGRPLVLTPALAVALWAMQAAALLRLGVAMADWGVAAIAAAALLWALCFAAYLVVHGPMLLGASLPRSSPE